MTISKPSARQKFQDLVYQLRTTFSLLLIALWFLQYTQLLGWKLSLRNWQPSSLSTQRYCDGWDSVLSIYCLLFWKLTTLSLIENTGIFQKLFIMYKTRLGTTVNTLMKKTNEQEIFASEWLRTINFQKPKRIWYRVFCCCCWFLFFKSGRFLSDCLLQSCVAC